MRQKRFKKHKHIRVKKVIKNIAITIQNKKPKKLKFAFKIALGFLSFELTFEW